MRRKVVSILVFLFLVITIWYLFIKEYDYQISFQADMAPQGIYYEVKNLKSWRENKESSVAILDQIIFKNIRQRVSDGDVNFRLDWNFENVNDTITKIVVGVISEENKVSNRIRILLGSSVLVSDVKNELINFRSKLLEFSKTFSVQIDGETQMPDFDYASVLSRSKRSQKASEMIAKNSSLIPVIDNNMETGDYPFVRVTSWDMNTDDLEFYFGFPIHHKNHSVTPNTNFHYGKLSGKKAVKATFYGNYRNSDQAWFVLINYAKKHNIDLVLEPLEIFYNNPMQGGNELEWRAEVYLPIKE